MATPLYNALLADGYTVAPTAVDGKNYVLYIRSKSPGNQRIRINNNAGVEQPFDTVPIAGNNPTVGVNTEDPSVPFAYTCLSPISLEISCAGATVGSGCVELNGTFNVRVDNTEVLSNATPEELEDFFSEENGFVSVDCDDQNNPVIISCAGASHDAAIRIANIDTFDLQYNQQFIDAGLTLSDLLDAIANMPGMEVKLLKLNNSGPEA